MNAFQWIFCTFLAVAILRDVLVWRRVDGLGRWRMIRVAVWAVAMAAISGPLEVTRLANMLGIMRGADIVLYVVSLAFVAVSFVLYAQLLRLRRDVSVLASHIALREARHGTSPDAPSTPRAS